jgi:hypothetical protein
MTHWPRLVTALAVKNLLHLFAIVWVSIVVLLALFVRPDVIDAMGPLYWMFTVLPLFILLYMIWISFVVMVRRDAHLFATASAPRTRRAADRTPRL